jgi:hypothetical protein
MPKKMKKLKFQISINQLTIKQKSWSENYINTTKINISIFRAVNMAKIGKT